MELYTLDSLLRRTAVVDQYQSLIWTERYSTAGDFQLIIPTTDANRAILSAGTRLAVNRSYRVMVIEEISDALDTQGRSLLTIKGPSLESSLDDSGTRVIPTDGTALPDYVITDTPANIARQVFTDVCVNNPIIEDRLPFYSTGSLYPVDNNFEDYSILQADIGPESLYTFLTDFAKTYGLGFRLYRGLDTSKLYFDVYVGQNRTTSQNDYPAIIFSENLGTLGEVSELRSLTDFKNVAYVFSTNGSAIVYANGYENVKGLDRKMIVVNASGIDPALTGSALQLALAQAGQAELNNHKQLQAIDGQAPQQSIYKYGIDYQLGDLVEMRDQLGNIQNMRVTEQIFAQDDQGERDYPTLVADSFITPGSWSAWDSNEEWASETNTWSTI